MQMYGPRQRSRTLPWAKFKILSSCHLVRIQQFILHMKTKIVKHHHTNDKSYRCAPGFESFILYSLVNPFKTPRVTLSGGNKFRSIQRHFIELIIRFSWHRTMYRRRYSALGQPMPWVISFFFLNKKKFNIFRLMHIAWFLGDF